MSETLIKLSQRGQITLPVELRRKLHWEPGQYLRLDHSDTQVKLEAVEKGSDPWNRLVKTLTSIGATDEDWKEIHRFRHAGDR